MSARDLLHDMLAAGFTVEVNAGKLLVTPASALTADMRQALRGCKPELLALLAEGDYSIVVADHRAGATQRCADCQHLTRVSTCSAPVQAGLLTAAEGFGIVWPPAAHAASCAAFSASTPSKAQERPYRLTREQGDAAHAEAWDDGAIVRFQARVRRLARLSLNTDDADDLAERLHLRDVEGEDRTLCVECSHYRPGRCGNHRDAGLHTAELARDTAVTLQRCTGFAA